jgi:GAF domain-containing protein
MHASADNETDRLAELTAYQILDTPAEDQFDRIVNLARVLFDAPSAAISLIDRDRQWLKARAGMARQQTSRADSFCTHTIQGEDVFVVADARMDPRFANNPLVVGDPNIRFYAGAPLRTPSGYNLGALCVISPEAREGFSEADARRLEVLASIVGNELDLRRQALEARQQAQGAELNLREARLRLKNSVDYADLLAEVASPDMPTAQLSAVAVAAWQQYTEAGAVLNRSIRALRERLSAGEYRTLMEGLPGFAM